MKNHDAVPMTVEMQQLDPNTQQLRTLATAQVSRLEDVQLSAEAIGSDPVLVNYRTATLGGSFTLGVNTLNVGYDVSHSYTVVDCSLDPDFGKDYRFGYNGQHKDNEIKGVGNSLDFGARMYDSRLSRWLSVDSKFKKYPSMSSYVAFGNSPLIVRDPDGKDLYIGGEKSLSLADIQSLVPEAYRTQLSVVDDKVVFNDFNNLPDNIKSYEGVSLLNTMITSDKKYKYSVSDNAAGRD